MKEFFAKLLAKTRSAEQSTEQRYQSMVRDLAAGREPSAEETLAVLKDTSRTAADLEADVERATQRAAWKATLLEREAAEHVVHRSEGELAALEEKFAAVKLQHEIAVDGVRRKRDAAAATLGHVMDAERRLRETAPADFAGQEKAIMFRGREVSQKLHTLNGRIESYKTEAHNLAVSTRDDPASRTANDKLRGESLATIKRLKEEAAPLEAEAAELGKRLETIDREKLAA